MYIQYHIFFLLPCYIFELVGTTDPVSFLGTYFVFVESTFDFPSTTLITFAYVVGFIN
jgi:hypothetical protein